MVKFASPRLRVDTVPLRFMFWMFSKANPPVVTKVLPRVWIRLPETKVAVPLDEKLRVPVWIVPAAAMFPISVFRERFLTVGTKYPPAPIVIFPAAASRERVEADKRSKMFWVILRALAAGPPTAFSWNPPPVLRSVNVPGVVMLWSCVAEATAPFNGSTIEPEVLPKVMFPVTGTAS